MPNANRTETLHTPGPWELRERPNSGGGYYIDPVCEVLGSGKIPLANARLIAAAPELVQMLRVVMAELDGAASMLTSGDSFNPEELGEGLAELAGDVREVIAKTEKA